SLQNGHLAHHVNGRPTRLLVLGEVLWDVFEESTRLGGAPLNFAAHVKRLGYNPRLISAVGYDHLGDETVSHMTDLGLDTSFVQRTCRYPTGIAHVELGPGDRTSFTIARPSAYDSLSISNQQITQLQDWAPAWFYYGTLFSHLAQGKAVLDRLTE